MTKDYTTAYTLNAAYGSSSAISLKDIEKAMADLKTIDYTIDPQTIYGSGLISDYGIKLTVDEEEWIWVTGYKATNKDMQCRDYQYELGKQHDMPENEPVTMCCSGFHFCDKLRKTFNYYAVQNGNRYFEVKALVRRWKKDGYYVTKQSDDKMVAKSIILTRELSIDEIFNELRDDEIKTWTTEQKERARQTSIGETRNAIKAAKLIELGYSEAFATYVVNKSAYDIAYTMAMSPDVSMDVKVLTVCMSIFRR